MPQAYQNTKLSARERAESLLSIMTLKEKVGQLNQKLYGFSGYERQGEELLLSQELMEEVEKYSGLGTLYGLYRADPWSGKTFENGLAGTLAIKAYNQVQRYVVGHSRLGIPMLLSNECPHGHQALDGYLLPVNLGSGASFCPKLLEEAYEVCGSQLKQMGVNLALVSVLDILRDPRWGRSEECFGEDPYLAAEFARAAVTGLQKSGVAVVAKHFCAQGEGTGGVNASAARIGERELREIHLPVVKACIEAGVKGIMAAYNEIDGVPCHANYRLLTEILREEMGFTGFVMSDGVAIDQLDEMTGDRVLSGAIALNAGVDMGLWDEAFGFLEEAYNRGLVTMNTIDRAVLRVLTLKFEQGLFEQPYLKEDQTFIDYNHKDYPQAYRLASEAIVLLKNENNILPIDTKHISSIAVIGPNADEIYHQLGDYTPPVREGEGVTVLQGMKRYIAGGAGTEIKFAQGCNLFDGTREEIRKAASLAGSCDLTVLVLGGSSSRFGEAVFDKNGAVIASGKVSMDCGEGVDCATLELPEIQRELARAVFQTGSRVITVLLQGRPYVITDIEQGSQGLLSCFYPGMAGGLALAEILFGKVSPSGHLSVSLPRHAGQLPVYYNYKASYAAMKYYDMEQGPLFPFGYGLCYTSFEYSDFYISKPEFSLEELEQESIVISCSVTNSGNMGASAVLLLYLRDMQASVIRRVRELKAFEKQYVPQGTTINIRQVLNRTSLSYWDHTMKFIVEPGDFELILSDGVSELWRKQIRLRK